MHPTPLELPDAYRPTPSVSRLITEITQETFWARYAAVRGDKEFRPEYIAQRERTALLLRAVVTDLLALFSLGDETAANDAARAALAVRTADGLMPCGPTAARAWLRNEFMEYELNPAHPPNCPGHCGGTGEVMEPLIWDSEGVAVHEEPVACNRGEPEDPHPSDCRCGGTGTYRSEGERNLCLGYVPEPTMDDLADADSDPWATALQHAAATGYSSETPF
jgi:hypothetical protein